MADIQRPLKTFGTRKYVSERAAAPGQKAPVLSAEIDLDFDTLYNAWNTQGANVKPGGITAGMLGPNCVNSDNIVDGSVMMIDLAADCINSSKIVDGSIVAGDLATGAVTVDKIAAGASVASIGKHRRQGENLDITNTTLVNFLSVANIVARSTAAFPLGCLCIRAYVYGQFGAPTVDATVGIRLDRDGANIDVSSRKGQGNNAMWSMYYDDIISVPNANPHTYSISVYSADAFATVQGGSLVLFAPA